MNGTANSDKHYITMPQPNIYTATKYFNFRIVKQMYITKMLSSTTLIKIINISCAENLHI